jgi:hypothetical protein
MAQGKGTRVRSASKRTEHRTNRHDASLLDRVKNASTEGKREKASRELTATSAKAGKRHRRGGRHK